MSISLNWRTIPGIMAGLAMPWCGGYGEGTDRLEEENLGPAILSVTIPGSAQGEGPDGEDLVYVIANGNPAVFSAIEVPSGRLFYSTPLPGVHGSWGLTVTPDQTVYIASNRNGHLYRWQPGDEEAESVVGSHLLGETHLWRLDTDAEGRVYGGTYPNGKVFRYDPETDEVRDYGTMMEAVDYVRSTAVAGGTIYAGTSPRAHLFAIDAESGAKEEISLPGVYGEEADAVYDLTAAGDFVFARVTPSNDLLVYNHRQGEWIGAIPETGGFLVSPEGPDGGFYFQKDETLHRYDPDRNEVFDTGASLPFAARSFRWTEVNEEGFEGQSLVSVGVRGDLFLFNPESGNHLIRGSDVQGTPITIRSIEKGPEGKVYVGGYLAPQEMARFDPQSGELEKLPVSAQIEAMHVHDEKLYLGRYPRATVWELDPHSPVDGDTNPRKRLGLSEYGQDRPFGFASAGDRIAVGTVAVSGRLDGALVLLDPETEEADVFEGVVENQSLVSLAHRDGLIYGGTTVWGGLGIEPAEDEARLFIWDVENGEKVWEGVPLEGEKAISDLEFDNEGNLWGITASKLFRFDPESRSVEREIELYSYDWPRTYWQSSFLEYDEPAGMFYGVATGKLFAFEPGNDEAAILAEGVGYFARDEYGDFYFARGTDLVRARLRTNDEREGDSH